MSIEIIDRLNKIKIQSRSTKVIKIEVKKVANEGINNKVKEEAKEETKTNNKSTSEGRNKIGKLIKILDETIKYLNVYNKKI